MTRSWISLPPAWKLEDVQAGLNVVVTILSFLAPVIFVRFLWQQAARRVAAGRDVALHSLLTVSGPCEAFDVVLLLRDRILSTKYITILSQCAFVTLFAITAILSGPIARYSTARGSESIVSPVPGLLAFRNISAIEMVNVDANLTYERLDSAGFPTDQLLDYMPDVSTDWVYEPEQWNNSWTMECQRTPQTLLYNLSTNGNCTKEPYDELPGVAAVFPVYSQWQNFAENWNGWERASTYKDILYYIAGSNLDDYLELEDTNLSMKMFIGIVHMQGVLKPAKNVTGCSFGRGPVQNASYTKIECSLRRKREVEDFMHVTSPDITEPESLVTAFRGYYTDRLQRQSISDVPLDIVTPDEMVRLYQVYMIMKDMMNERPATRNLSVDTPVVRLSVAFLTSAILVALFILLGFLNWVFFAIRHYRIMKATPESKLDWMMQSIEAEDRPIKDSKGRLRRSVTVDSTEPLMNITHDQRRTIEFQAARYGGRETSTWFLKNSMVSTQYSHGSDADYSIAEAHPLSSPSVVESK